LPVLQLQTMKQAVMNSVSEQSLIASFLIGFAGFALALAMIGIYSIIAYSVVHRMHEIGLRIALGASRRDIFRLTLREGASLTGKGLVLGMPVALALSRGIGSLLFSTSPHDLLVFAGIPFVFALIALASGYIPARRAAKVDPIVALRYE
jgi:ABC-type antimicrobial peptide transport system permease subunit